MQRNAVCKFCNVSRFYGCFQQGFSYLPVDCRPDQGDAMSTTKSSQRLSWPGLEPMKLRFIKPEHSPKCVKCGEPYVWTLTYNYFKLYTKTDGLGQIGASKRCMYENSELKYNLSFIHRIFPAYYWSYKSKQIIILWILQYRI